MKPNTGKIRIYRGYINDTEYEWLIAPNLEAAKKEFAKKFPGVNFIKIKQKG